MRKGMTKRCVSILTACMMLTAAAQVTVPMSGMAAENLITNANFDAGTKDWGMYKESGGAATLTTEDGKLALKITSVGKLTYSLQMFYDIIPLYQNGVYHFHYEISSSVPRIAEGMIQLNSGDYHSYTWKKLNLTTEPLIVDYDFTMEDPTDIMAKLVINCGNEGEELPEHTVYLDNVSLELVDDSQVDYAADAAYQPDILVNQVGFRTASKKTAVVRKTGNTDKFTLVDANTKQDVFSGTLSAATQNSSADEMDQVADFSDFNTSGTYYIHVDGLDDSYPFTIGDTPYTELLDESVRMLYLQRCGCKVEDKDFGHAACHTSMATIYHTNDKIDVSGGWHDAGDYGRYVVPAAKSIADMLYAYADQPTLYSDSIGIPESGNGVPDILDEARYELEWMLKMQAPSGGVYHKVSCESFPGMTVMPQAETGQLIVTPVSTTATADFCASMALAAEFYADIDKTFADTCMNAAEKAWSFLEQNPNLIFSNPSDISTGDYGDKSDKDERYWAACQMYRTTKDSKYLDAVNAMATSSGMDWSLVGDYGNIAILTMKDADASLYESARKTVLKSADSFKTVTERSPYGSPITKYNWGSNMTIANAGVILGLAARMTGDQSYLDAANQNLSYLLGCNPLGTSFVTGFGTVAPEHPHHRPSISVGKPMPGMLVGGVNSSLEDSAAEAYCKGAPAAKCYIDNDASYSTNEITIYWNSPLIYLLSLTEPDDLTPPDPITTTTTTEETTTTTTTTTTTATETTTSTTSTTTETVTNDPNPGNGLKGDANCDGAVNVGDAVLIARVAASDKTVSLTEQGNKNADVTGDESVTSADLTRLLQFLGKKIPTL